MKKIIFSLMFFSSILFSNTLEQIESSGVIRIGVNFDYPPFSSERDGEFSGFEIEFAKQIGNKLFGSKGGIVKFITEDTDERIPNLQKNNVDIVIDSLTVTDDREKLIDFSMPYFSTNVGLLTRKSDKIKKESDLFGKTVLVIPNTPAGDFFKNKGYNLIKCGGPSECYRLFSSGTGDAFADDNIAVLAFPILDRTMEVGIKNLGDTNYLAIGVQKGNKELLKKINDIMIDLSREGFFKKSFNNTINPFYKGTAEEKYFLLEDIYRIFG
ncbi:amino acid ABC transporter, periplasmic cysteine-binding protein [Campylobacter blaseri]|uniref:Amino acid ABC transporter substrate-binding protein n=1 Tax=Campylobacter blaseri TaxID=2042961 RepID=A0A2P8R0E5_9BACT|nr:transporter substrate-binding domain-containing protein [Campylobacter blaseri]PSM51974.1 amino acid ABC transporter substrate-binding protein [Campylobacter blaseri]PSM53759.1 amino acid ABC transporter substrate-binding protein [Campylobacter blaseri]QKF85687.1 amino acid ABC transporter, periplasmic cysteine-binding protein [Campylobacter blaseri]